MSLGCLLVSRTKVYNVLKSIKRGFNYSLKVIDLYGTTIGTKGSPKMEKIERVNFYTILWVHYFCGYQRSTN